MFPVLVTLRITVFHILPVQSKPCVFVFLDYLKNARHSFEIRAVYFRTQTHDALGEYEAFVNIIKTK